MNRLSKRVLAEALFVLHFFLVVFVALGWMIESLRYVYIAILIATFISDATLGYCLLSRWEFKLRKSVDHRIHYDHTWLNYYAAKILGQQKISNSFIERGALIFLTVALAANMYAAI